ncbi:MAG: DUF4129 domain-containing protein [Gallintestinimicrobium sp.]
MWLGLANSLTAQELTRQAWGDTGHEDWEQLTELYEQARYGGTEPEREQARAAVKLSEDSAYDKEKITAGDADELLPQKYFPFI